MDSCIFCKIASGEIPSVKVYESDRVLAFLDVNPMAKGHVLVVPKTHWRDLASVPDDPESRAVVAELFAVIRGVMRAVTSSFATGANLLQCNGESAGQTVFHLHFHVIPRTGAAADPDFRSGAGAYASDAERDEYAAKIRSNLTV